MSAVSARNHRDLHAAALRPLSAVPRPFLKWAGSKRYLLHQIVDVLPKSYGAYYEPFLGSGAMFFLLQPRAAHLSDTCQELVDTYRALRENGDAVIRYLKPLRPTKESYYKVRGNRSDGRYKRAAEFIFLNKTCWNGLYRVNSDGEFNVPYGAPKTANVFDEPNLRECSRTLDSPDVTLRCQSFERALQDVQVNDLVFLDPPYVTGHNNNGFIDYNEDLFSWDDQVTLARRARQLADAGAHVLVTNANHDAVRELYPGFESRELRRTSTLAGKREKRGPVTEILLWGGRG